jgi:farnesyl diphosphate synthase
LLPDEIARPRRVMEAMRYSTLGGGKRLRPFRVVESSAVFGVPRASALLAGAALECIHCYSLIHDDLPAMDNDTMRRGRPTLHVVAGEGQAILAGDALQSLAFQLLAEHALSDDPQAQLDMVRLFAAACGSRGMAGGQAIDLDAVGKSLTLPELEFMHILKTGALIRASVLLGARCGAPLAALQVERLDRYAKCVGLAFQVVDDILDEEGEARTLGKTAGKDRASGKPTYTSLMSLAEA